MPISEDLKKAKKAVRTAEASMQDPSLTSLLGNYLAKSSVDSAKEYLARAKANIRQVEDISENLNKIQEDEVNLSDSIGGKTRRKELLDRNVLNATNDVTDAQSSLESASITEQTAIENLQETTTEVTRLQKEVQDASQAVEDAKLEVQESERTANEAALAQNVFNRLEQQVKTAIQSYESNLLKAKGTLTKVEKILCGLPPSPNLNEGGSLIQNLKTKLGEINTILEKASQKDTSEEQPLTQEGKLTLTIKAAGELISYLELAQTLAKKTAELADKKAAEDAEAKAASTENKELEIELDENQASNLENDLKKSAQMLIFAKVYLGKAETATETAKINAESMKNNLAKAQNAETAKTNAENAAVKLRGAEERLTTANSSFEAENKQLEQHRQELNTASGVVDLAKEELEEVQSSLNNSKKMVEKLDEGIKGQTAELSKIKAQITTLETDASRAASMAERNASMVVNILAVVKQGMELEETESSTSAPEDPSERNMAQLLSGYGYKDIPGSFRQLSMAERQKVVKPLEQLQRRETPVIDAFAAKHIDSFPGLPLKMLQASKDEATRKLIADNASGSNKESIKSFLLSKMRS